MSFLLLLSETAPRTAGSVDASSKLSRSSRALSPNAKFLSVGAARGLVLPCTTSAALPVFQNCKTFQKMSLKEKIVYDESPFDYVSRKKKNFGKNYFLSYGSLF